MDSMPSTSGDSVVSPPTTAAAAAAASPPLPPSLPTPSPPPPPPPSSSSPLAHNHQQLSRYESQKRRDWNTFMQYLKSHNPPVTLPRCSGSHVIDFLKYLDQFGKTKVHSAACPFFGHPKPPEPCACPLRQAWGSLDALIGRLRAAYDENDGKPETNPFGARAVRMYLREVKECQAKARGIPYEKKKRKRHHAAAAAAATMENTARCATSNSIQALGAKVEEETADPPKNTWTS